MQFNQSDMSKLKKTTLYIQGMHCPSCDILIKRKFKEIANIKDVKANHRKQEAEVCYVGTLDKHRLNQQIHEFGYQIGEKAVEPVEPLSKRLTDAGAIALILFIAYFFAQEMKLLPDFNATSGLTLTTVFILGLVASTSTCMATSGALFLSTIGKLSRADAPRKENILPSISFNLGRIVSYGAFGFVFGLVGKTIASNLQFGSALSLIVSVMMILIGLDMLKLFSIGTILPTAINKGLFEKLEYKLMKAPKKTSFSLGAITYLLPCGFTQAVQIYALGLADPVQSATIMMVFALGTTPALLALGYASVSFTKHALYPMFQKIMAVLVLIIGVSYIGNTMALYGLNVNAFFNNNSPSNAEAADPNVRIENGVQIVKMNVGTRGYEPSSFTIKQNLPVRWEVNGENVFGCQGYLTAPKANVNQMLESGKNVFEFTPKEKGLISFSCSMGMVRGQFNVI